MAGESAGREWYLASGDLRTREWDDCLVLYHGSSGDTHLLNPFASAIVRLLAQGSADHETLREALRQVDGEVPDALESTLAELQRLGIVESRDRTRGIQGQTSSPG